MIAENNHKMKRSRRRKGAFILLIGTILIAIIGMAYWQWFKPQVLHQHPGPTVETSKEMPPHEGPMPTVPHTPPLVGVRLSPEVAQRAEVRTEAVQKRQLTKRVQTVGRITYDERRLKYATAWIDGRIDKLYVDFTGVKVKKNAPLVLIYSPELLSTQDEYLLAMEGLERLEKGGNAEAIAGARSLLEATKKRLLLWGIRPHQIRELQETKKANTHMTIHSPISGTVIHKNALEGMYVKTGDKLYTIADLSQVWMLADIFEYEMAWIKLGQRVLITSPAYPQETFKGKVIFIDPFLNEKTRTVAVRMDVPNPGEKLKPGMFVDARIQVPVKESAPVLSIPVTGVLDTGVRKLVYIERHPGHYQGVEVEIGPRAGNYYPVISGLKEGDLVVVSANYLIDAQSTLGAAAAAYGGAIEGEAAPPVHRH